MNGKFFPIATAIVDPTGETMLFLDAVGCVKKATGGFELKFQVLIKSDDPQAWMDLSNYGEKLFCFGSPDGSILGCWMVDVQPEDAHRPSRVYEFYNALVNVPIEGGVRVDLVNQDTAEDISLDGVEKIELPELSMGCWLIHPISEGFDDNKSYFVSYKNLWSTIAVNRIFMNPTGSIEDGCIRVVLTWGEDPRDLDLHCFSSKGEHVYFVKKNDKALRLDVDVTNGLGPETLTVTVEAGVTYYFYAHHFAGEGTLSKSGAKMKVYGVQGIDTVVIPSGASAPYGPPEAKNYKGYWHAFVIEGDGKVRVVNEVVRATAGAQTGRTF